MSSDDPTDTPTHDTEAARQEGAEMGRSWLQVAVVATFGTLLLALGLLQATGLVDLFAPIAGSEPTQWLVFVVLALVVAVVGAWSWKTA